MPADRKSARPSTAPSRDALADATRLLADDHREVRGLFEQYRRLADDDASGEERRPLAEEICTLLTVHAAIEEEIFYPAARAAAVDASVLDEAEVEHASAKDLIAQIRDMEPDAPLYDAKVKVLGEYMIITPARKSRSSFRSAGPPRWSWTTSASASQPARTS